MAFAFGAAGFVLIPETYAAAILSHRATKIRNETGNMAVRSKLDEQEVTFKDITQTYLFRPFIMLALEPILLLTTLYMGFIYGMHF